MNESPDPIHELIERYFLNPSSLSDAEQVTLSDVLRSNPDARKHFRLAAHVDAELRYEASGEAQPTPPPTSPSGSADTWPKWIVAIAATLLIGLALGYVAWPLTTTRSKPVPVARDGKAIPAQPKPVKPTNRPIALLDVGHNQRFDESLAPQAGKFFPGKFRLIGGEITLAFENGVSVSVESPATFSIIDSFHMELEKGRARAIVPETGHGFIIETPKLLVEDLGTEFGVYVDEDQNQELHVFAGEVRLKDRDQPAELLTENSAIAWNAQDQRRSIAADDHAFATSMSIGFKRWLDHSLKLRNDPATLFYFDFETNSRQSREVINRAPSQIVPDGSLHGGIWATGRWPEKGAMLFENHGDRIDLDIPGEYDHLTIMAWVQANRYDNALQTVFNSIDYAPGQHHWNLTRNGELRMGIKDQVNYTSLEKLPRNRWTHVAAQLDSIKKESIYYINGKEVKRCPWNESVPLNYGPATIGAYGSMNRAGQLTYSRELRGRIDEIALFGRILSAQEIQEAYEAGSSFQ
ncbi:hypothetical protein GC197_02140 [bacterium]|nr:hypothetical protein [bacterium]